MVAKSYKKSLSKLNIAIFKYPGFTAFFMNTMYFKNKWIIK